jgi:hypothetical protein
MPARLRSPGRHAHLLPFPARRPVPVFLALFFFDDSRAPSHFIPLHPAKLLGEWFAQACVIRHRVQSLRIHRSNQRNSPRLRLHLRDARHRRKPLSVGSCPRRGQILCWQVRRFHPCRRTTGSIRGGLRPPAPRREPWRADGVRVLAASYRKPVDGDADAYQHTGLVLLCHKAGRPSVPHQGQRGRRAASRRAWPIRSELSELGLWRSGRTGGSA